MTPGRDGPQCITWLQYNRPWEGAGPDAFLYFVKLHNECKSTLTVRITDRTGKVYVESAFANGERELNLCSRYVGPAGLVDCGGYTTVEVQN